MRKLIGILIVSLMLFACGGGSGSGSSSGTVALFATDDISNYKQTISTINKVQLVQQGANGMTCDVLPIPVSIDISNLSSVIQLLNVSNCISGSYNTIHIEFEKSTKLMDQGNTSATCSFTSYKDNNNQPNTLQCKESNCSLDINEAVNVLANQSNKLVLDFNLKEFEVNNFSSANCSATMKISSLDTSEIASKKSAGYKDGISGYILNLNTYAKTFIIIKGNKTFTIHYSGISQQNIDQLLRFAVDNNLKIKIEFSNFDINAGTCIASAIVVKVEGTLSALNITKHTFFLTYQTTKTISMDYTEANTNNRVEGQLSDGASIEVKLNGYSSNYTTNDVEVKDVETEN